MQSHKKYALLYYFLTGCQRCINSELKVGLLSEIIYIYLATFAVVPSISKWLYVFKTKQGIDQ